MIFQGLFGEGNFLSAMLNYGNSFLAKYDPTIKRYSYSMVYFMVGGLIHFYANNIKEKCQSKRLIINIIAKFCSFVTFVDGFAQQNKKR